MAKKRDDVDRPKRGCVSDGVAIVMTLAVLAVVALCFQVAGLSPARKTPTPTTAPTVPTATPTPALVEDAIISPAIVTPEPPTAAPTPTIAVRAVPVVPIVVACPGGCVTPPDPSCDIKGNISIDGGERIYHVPGGRFYEVTNIDPEYGERWFCTEAEAVEAGWRRSQR